MNVSQVFLSPQAVQDGFDNDMEIDPTSCEKIETSLLSNGGNQQAFNHGNSLFINTSGTFKNLSESFSSSVFLKAFGLPQVFM